MRGTFISLFLALILVFIPLQDTSARSNRLRLPSYERALKDISKGRTNNAKILVARSRHHILNEVLLVELMAQPGNDYNFQQLARFIMQHPDWPNMKGIRLIAEQKMPSNMPTKQILNWYTSYPPLTGIGFSRYIDSLNASGQENKAIKLVRSRWINKNFDNRDFKAYQSRYAPLLRKKDHRKRLDRLLWDERTTSAKKMYRYVYKSDKNLAEARIALIKNKGRVGPLINRVAAKHKKHPGLMFDRLKWRKKRGMRTGVLEILKNPPHRLGRPKLWWKERHIMARRLMERKQYTRAYYLVRKNGLTDDDGFAYLQAEFLAGWLALRKLKKPLIAEEHFRHITDTASSPISKARGYYWLGRAQESNNNRSHAAHSYESASMFNTTYYGQLAIAKLYNNPYVTAQPEPEIPSNIRKQFFARRIIKATEQLARKRLYNHAKKYFMAAAYYATKRVEYALLMELATMIERPDWAIKTAKIATQRGMLITGAAYPVLSTHIPTPPDLAFTHALIRQESLFDPKAGSHVGARGLMQLMPGTARDVARKLGIRYRKSKLTNPRYNLRLGTYFIQKQIDNFDGSLILALAAYNAGPRRAREWISKFGDPRLRRVDAIDWVESISIYETRNYIQRILESLQFYRARLNGGKAPLRIEQDLSVSSKRT